MYTAYFMNTQTGKILRTSSPSDNPNEKYWIRISEDEYNLLNAVANSRATFSMVLLVGNYYHGTGIIEKAVAKGLER